MWGNNKKVLKNSTVSRTIGAGPVSIGWHESAVQKLIELVEQCEQDTCRLLGTGAAIRLGHWRDHTSSEPELIDYVQKLLWGEHCENGYKLDQRGGLSLERIVLDRCAEMFTDADKEQARRTLRLK